LDISQILAELRNERDRINDAINVLEKGSVKIDGRTRAARQAGKRRKRRLTPEGRKRLSDMMKKRWAERKKRAKAA
jgi:Spy/CpxP family protein refolding chaperone